MTKVWLASYPRSGVTFLRLVLEAMYGVKTYTVYSPTDDTKAFGDLFPGGRAASKDIPDGDGYAFVKTHENGQDGMDFPAIHLVRDGRDALVSQAHFLRAGGSVLAAGMPFDEVLKMLIIGRFPRMHKPPWNWSEHTKAWAGRSNSRLLYFSHLQHAPEGFVTGTCIKMGLVLQEIKGARAPGFAQLHARSPDFFRRGKVGGWQDDMSDELHELFWEHHGEAMELVGYKREAECLSS